MPNAKRYMPVQVRLAALKREEDGLHREHDRLEHEKRAYLKHAPFCMCPCCSSLISALNRMTKQVQAVSR